MPVWPIDDDVAISMVRENDELFVCLRCGVVFIPMSVTDPSEESDTTACPICDRDPIDAPPGRKA